MRRPWLALIESNTSGTGRLFARASAGNGFQPILFSADPSRYAYAVEDKIQILEIDTTNEDTLSDACQRLASDQGLVGVTSSSEYFAATAAAIAERLGLPGPRAEAIRACRNKSTQRLRIRATGLGSPMFQAVDSILNAIATAKNIGLPVIVKPVEGSGSVGVKLCRSVGEVEEQARRLFDRHTNERGLPIPRQVLVEEFVEGPEFSVETFGMNIVGITKKYLSAPPHFVEVGHDFPAMLPADTERAINRTVLDALSALGLGWGPAHVELRLAEEGPTIIEVNSRLAGGFIPEVVRLACGVDLIDATIKKVAGLEPRVEKTLNRYASIRFILPESDGRLLAIEGSSLAEQTRGLVELCVYSKAGTLVRRRGDFRDRIGHVIACGDTYADTVEAAETAHRAVHLKSEPTTVVVA